MVGPSVVTEHCGKLSNKSSGLGLDLKLKSNVVPMTVLGSNKNNFQKIEKKYRFYSPRKQY